MSNQVFVIGFPKCGSSYLVDFIKGVFGYQDIGTKEPHYWSYGIKERVSLRGPGDQNTVQRVFDRYRDLYKKQIDDTTIEHFIDGSVSYIFEAKVIHSIKSVFPHAKFIVVLRDPVDRMISAHGYLKSDGYEKLSFLDAINAEIERKRAGYQHLWLYHEGSQYFKQLSQSGVFDFKGDVLFLTSRHLNDKNCLIQKIKNFLEVPPVNTTFEVVEKNKTLEWNNHIVKIITRIELIKSIYRFVFPQFFREKIRYYYKSSRVGMKPKIPKFICNSLLDDCELLRRESVIDEIIIDKWIEHIKSYETS